MGKSADEMSARRVVISAGPGEVTREGRRSVADREPDDRRIYELRADIRHKRQEMAYTVEALQHRLEPDRLKEQVRARVRAKTVGRAQDMLENTRSTGSGLLDRIRENPIPAAMVAVGLGWLFTRPQERFDGEARARASELAGRAQDRASEMGDRARMQAYRAQGGFQQMLDDNPLGLGALALAAGAAIGLAAPSTAKEHELMGEARDSLLDQAQAKAQNTVQKAQQVAKTAVSSAKEEAANQGLTSS